MKIQICFLMLFLAIPMITISLSAATIDGVPLHASISGKGPKTVILIHGWTCDVTSWKSQVSPLSRNYRVITLDLPGHGQSRWPENGKLSMDLFARAVEAVRSEAKTERVVLAGHSMGTAVILQYARLFPEHVAGLVFVDGMVYMPPNLKETRSFAEQFGGPNGLKAREAMIRRMFTFATTPEMQKHILKMMLGAPAETAVGAMKAVMDPATWKEDVFAQPVLGLYAEGSSNRNSEYMQGHFPKMDYKEIPGTGHFLMLEKPAEFNRLLMEFLGQQKY
jgi:pimeloyl-ACP methyl ester carboxylesterase